MIIIRLHNNYMLHIKNHRLDNMVVNVGRTLAFTARILLFPSHYAMRLIGNSKMTIGVM